MPETRKIAAILVADVVGFSRLAGADEERTLARLRALMSDLFDPTIAVHHGRLVKRTGDGALVEFRSVVDAVRCAIEVQNGMAERNAGLPLERAIELRIGVHLGDVVEESDGDLMGDGVNVAARLQAICEPGGVCVSASAHEHLHGRVEAVFDDLGEKSLKNIARPVRAYGLRPCSVPASEAESPGAFRNAGRRPASERREPSRLSMVVLPFAYIGGDPEQDYFADGVTESLTTDLSCISGAFVVARNTAFTYKGKLIDAKSIGRELNVRYVLEGSIQRGGGRMRVNVQLIDAETGSHVWADRFDKTVADLFDMQDEIVARVANEIGAEIARAEAGRAERSANPDSMDHYFLGLAFFNKGLTAELLGKARAHFDHAVDLDPSNADALAYRAFVDILIAVTVKWENRQGRLRAVEADLRKALVLKPDSALVHCAMGALRIYTNRALDGIAECERALAIDRNYAVAHGWIGMGKYFAGRNDESEAHVLEAMRLSPRDTMAWAWTYAAGVAKLGSGRDEEAVAWLKRSIGLNASVPLTYFMLAAALGRLGRTEEAREAGRLGLELDPGYTIAKVRAAVYSDNPVYLASRERIYEGLRLAGIPEG